MTLLSRSQMQAAEQFIFALGTQSLVMMEQAGQAAADYIRSRHPKPCPVLVCCGPGSNGGDGFIIAEILRKNAYPIQVACLVDIKTLNGNARQAAVRYRGTIIDFHQIDLSARPLIVDAIFGIGLKKAIEGPAAAAIQAINDANLSVIAIDIPSGIDPDSGAVMGIAIKASATISFGAKKYGHLLLPGRLCSGEVHVADIGITPSAMDAVSPLVFDNQEKHWMADWPEPQPEFNKYHRGHTLILGGSMLHAGAAKLAGLAALRVGAGLVSIIAGEKDIAVYAQSALSLMTKKLSSWSKLIADERNPVFVIGPGLEPLKLIRDKVLDALRAQKRVVLDAGGLTAFADKPERLFKAIQSPCILTPHSGEFAKIFSSIDASHNKLVQAQTAAKTSGAVVILKGFDTVIAAPDGRSAINSNAPCQLATAGSGDVLAGLCGGLLAQGMESFAAACAAVWIHAEAAQQQKSGLIAEDLLKYLPKVLGLWQTAKMSAGAH